METEHEPTGRDKHTFVRLLVAWERRTASDWAKLIYLSDGPFTEEQIEEGRQLREMIWPMSPELREVLAGG